jgi:hypothetical protein
MGLLKPGEIGFDLMHFNLIKPLPRLMEEEDLVWSSWSIAKLAPFLPVPLIGKNEVGYFLIILINKFYRKCILSMEM